MDGETASRLKEIVAGAIMGTITKDVLSAGQGSHPAGHPMTDYPIANPTRHWNPENALARVEGDKTLLLELIQLFLDDYPKTMEELRTAISRGDVKSLERHAHTIKGSAANFEAIPTVTAGLQLETSGYEKDLTSVARQMTDLETALADLRTELEAFLTGSTDAH